MILCALFAALMAVCSWITIPYVVPFTMQTFAVFVALDLLGWRGTLITVLVYMALGAVGLPVFSGFSGGVMPWNISVVHNEKGAPAAELTGAAKERLEQIGGAGVRISLSHEGDSAIAFAVIGGF